MYNSTWIEWSQECGIPDLGIINNAYHNITSTDSQRVTGHPGICEVV